MPDRIPGSIETNSVLTVGGSAVSGMIDVGGDQDWWRVSLNANTAYQFHLNGYDFSDPYLRLLNSSGGELAVNDDGHVGTDSLISYTPTASGTYYLSAQAYGRSTGVYYLTAIGSGTSSSSSETYWWLLDTASDSVGGNPLAHIVYDGLEFTHNGIYDQLYLPQSVFSRLDGSYGDFVGALNDVIASRPELAGYSVTLDWMNSKTITLPSNGTTSSTIPAIVLHAPLGVDVTSTGFLWYPEAGSSYEIYGEVADGPTTVSPGVDTIVGTSGNDIFYDSSNNSIFEGGYGLDTVIFSGHRAYSTITKTASGWTVSSATNGTDTLSSIERLQFADTSIAFDIDGTAGQVYRIYQAAFNRVPDLGGLGFWIDGMDHHGVSLSGVSAGFINSAEFASVYGANPTNSQIVTRFYENVLHRAPEQGGYDYWMYQVEHGMQATQVLTFFSESAENQAQVIGVIQNGIEYTQYTA